MLEKLRVKDYQGITEATIEPGRFTLIYGLNGSGKTTLVDALHLLVAGDDERGGTLASSLRQGASAFDVEAVLGGATFARHQTASGGKLTINGAEVKSSEFAAELKRRTGVEPRVFAAALRSGEVLRLDSTTLARFIAALTGAAPDKQLLEKAFSQEVRDAAKRASLALPTALAEFDQVRREAENARVIAKRAVAQARSEVDRLPQTDTKAIPGLKQQLDQVRAKIREAAAAHGAQAGRAEGVREGRLRAAEERLAKLGEDSSDVADPTAEVQKVDAQLEAAVTKRDEVEREGKRTKEILERVKKAGDKGLGNCPVLCGVECPVKDLGPIAESLTAQRTAQGKAWKKASAEVEALASSLDALKKQQAEFVALRERRAERERLVKEIAQLKAAPADAPAAPPATVDVAALEAHVAQLENQIREAELGQDRVKAVARLAEQEQLVKDADRVAQALGPEGVQAQVLAELSGPFTQAANEALAQLAPDSQLRLVAEPDLQIRLCRGTSSLSPAQLSDGEVVRLTHVLQIAVAKLAKVPVIALDRSELLDPATRSALKKVASAQSKSAQVLLLTSAEPPRTVPKGVRGYLMGAGSAHRLAEASDGPASDAK